VAIQTAVTPVDNILQAMAILVAKTIGVTKSCVKNLVTKPFVDGTGLTILFKMKKRRMQLLQSPTTTPLIQIGMQTSEQLTTLPMTSSA
jgi:L-serine deaminase